MKLLKYQDFILRSLFRENILLDLPDNSIKLSISVLSNKYKTRNTDNLIGIEVDKVLGAEMLEIEGTIETTINNESALILQSAYRPIIAILPDQPDGVLEVLIYDANTLTITDYYCSNVDYYDDSYNLTPKPINTMQDLIDAINKALSNNFNVLKRSNFNISIPISLAYKFSSLEGFEEYPSVILSTLDGEIPENIVLITYREVFDLTPETYGELYRLQIGMTDELDESNTIQDILVAKLYPNYILTKLENLEEREIASTKKDCINMLNTLLPNAHDLITGTLRNYIKVYYIESDTADK